MLLSIIIVNYKNPHLITQCVQSIVEYEKTIDYEIIVIDNYSNDDSECKLLSICPKLKWVQMDYNSGFGRANNVGIKQAKGDFILFLNSDIIIPTDNVLMNCIQHLQFLNDKNIVFGTKLCNKDGAYQETLRLRFPNLKDRLHANALYILLVNRLLKKYPMQEEKRLQYDAHQKSDFVVWINGAFLLVDRQVVLSKELFFDNDLFLYGEDIEWCWNARKKGMKFYHYSENQLIHIGSASMPDDVLKRAQIIVSDWVMLRKCRGRIFLALCLIFEYFNLVLDSLLYFLAKIRHQNFNEYVLSEKKFRSKYYYLIRKYGLMILFKNNLSSSKNFKTNCYEDTFLRQA